MSPLPDLMLEPQVRAALLEDLGRAGAITSDAIVPADLLTRCVLRAREPGVVAGLDLARLAFSLVDPRLQFSVHCPDGTAIAPGDRIATVSGPARGVLIGERVALNYLSHLSGIASATNRIVRAVAGTKARICETRKTIPGLRALQDEERLAAILRAVRARAPAATRLLVKLAPDLADESLAALVRMIADEGASGIIATNTTLARPSTLRSPHAAEHGGLSGAPLAARARAVLDRIAEARAGLHGGGTRLAIVSCGGIADGVDIAARLDAGADLVQLYTSWAYEGPALLARLERQLLASQPPRGA